MQLRLPANVQAAAFHGGAALGPVLAKTFDATSMLTRSNDQLATCPDSGRLLLRLEDDSPFAGARELHNVTIFYPCWLWPQADLEGIGAVKLRLAQMPYTSWPTTSRIAASNRRRVHTAKCWCGVTLARAPC